MRTFDRFPATVEFVRKFLHSHVDLESCSESLAQIEPGAA